MFRNRPAARHLSNLSGARGIDAPPTTTRLMFACHVDTVPAGDLSNWQFDPFAADVEGGVMRGRGTSDMKAGLVAATAAVLAAFGVHGAIVDVVRPAS